MNEKSIQGSSNQNFTDLYYDLSNNELTISNNELNCSMDSLTPLLPRVEKKFSKENINNKAIGKYELSKETSYKNWKLIENNDSLIIETLKEDCIFKVFRITNVKDEKKITLELICESCSSDKVPEQMKQNLRMFYGQVLYFNIRDDNDKVFCEFPKHRNNKLITVGRDNVLKLLGIMLNFCKFESSLSDELPEIFSKVLKESILYPKEQYTPSVGWLVAHNVNEVWSFEQTENGKVGKKISIKPTHFLNRFILIYSVLEIGNLKKRIDLMIQGESDQLIEEIKKILGVSDIIKETAFVFTFLLGLLKNN